MTGQAQTQGWTAAQFKTQVCNQIHAIFNCASGIYVDVEAYSSFASANLGMPITNGAFNSSAMGYNPGVPGQVVVVRVYYQYPVFFTPLQLSNVSGGTICSPPPPCSRTNPTPRCDAKNDVMNEE